MLGMNAGSATMRNHSQGSGLLVFHCYLLTALLLDIIVEQSDLCISLSVNFCNYNGVIIIVSDS